MSLNNINVSVAALLGTAQGSIIDKVAQALASKEIDRRVSIYDKAVSTYNVLKTNLDKVNKPDLISYVGDQRQEAFSEKRRSEISKAKAAVEKIEKLASDALGEQAKWKELDDYLKNPPKESDKAES